jgi:hypothetical protein
MSKSVQIIPNNLISVSSTLFRSTKFERYKLAGVDEILAELHPMHFQFSMV